MIDRELADALRNSFAAALRSTEAPTARNDLLEAGWLDALDHDEAAATAVVFRLQGALRRDAAALDDVMARRLAPHWSGITPGIAIAHQVGPSAVSDGGATHVVLPAQADARRVLWVSGPEGETLTIVELDDHLGKHAVGGVDPEFGLIGLSVPPPGSATRLPELSGAPWTDARAAGRVALAFQMTGGAHAVLHMAVAYARERRQFGQPIAAFQAVKHRLAETEVAIAAADAAAVAAAASRHPTAAAIAKALAGRAALTTAKNCLQVFGGIGVTTEHEVPAHEAVELVLDRLHGDHRTIERELGAHLRTGTLESPRVVELDLVPGIDPLGTTTT